jgi:UDP-N-acetylglucosamine transferase subunit ALG13
MCKYLIRYSLTKSTLIIKRCVNPFKKMNTKPAILVCPLNWGLGHTTRCIPIIRDLTRRGYQVHLVGYGQSGQLLKTEFPHLPYHQLPGFEVVYNTNGFLSVKLLLQLPAFIWHKQREKKLLKPLIAEIKPRYVISDNRYGLYHKQTTNIILTHQLNPAIPKLLTPFKWLVKTTIHYWIAKFDMCWIPDYADHRQLSGKLSAIPKKIKHAHFIGHLSRFACTETPLALPIPTLEVTTETSLTKSPPPSPKVSFTNCELLAIISGPEPQRTLFEKEIRTQLLASHKKGILVKGLVEQTQTCTTKGSIIEYNYLNSEQLKTTIAQCNMVICRAGYSSIMDLAVMNKTAILVPTPGQTEQLYLAQHLTNHKLFTIQNQSQINLCVKNTTSDKLI